jgi:hypothetical protein
MRNLGMKALIESGDVLDNTKYGVNMRHAHGRFGRRALVFLCSELTTVYLHVQIAKHKAKDLLWTLTS